MLLSPKWIATIAICFGLVFFPVQNAHALSPKAKVVALTAGYGAAAGALIGVASLAFGTKTRAIFVGASLGLYAGILVGAYMIFFPSKKRKPPPANEVYPNERYSFHIEPPRQKLIADPSHQSLLGNSQLQPKYEVSLLQISF